METATKRPRGRPRKYAPIPAGTVDFGKEETPSTVPIAPEELDSADAADLERDLQRAMDAVDDVQVFAVDRIVDDEDSFTCLSHTPTSAECKTATNEPKMPDVHEGVAFCGHVKRLVLRRKDIRPNLHVEALGLSPIVCVDAA